MVDAGQGVRLFARVRRSPARTAHALLLLHGFTGTSESWHTLAAMFAKHLDVIAVDLPGHGRSSAPTDPARYALDRLADDLATVVDISDVQRVIVLGYSMGGRSALKFALRHPGRLAGLVLESTSPGITDAAQRDRRRQSDDELATMLERDGITPFVNAWERMPLWSTQAALDQQARARLRMQRLAQSPQGLANALRGAGQGIDAPVAGRLADIRVPVLLIAGALDGAYVAWARTMTAALPEAHLEIVPEAGHAVHLERPAEYASLVNSFLARNSFIPPGERAGIEQEME
jgi:2-succinyl-6-hydroxy-2,4-cyclohexadiene-1-carboxylate synthase